MRIIELLIIYLLSFCTISCHNHKKEESEIDQTECVSLKIRGDLNKLLQVDSIFSEIKVIPLETNNNCLITEIVKIDFFGDLLFVHDAKNKLFVFDTEGRFMYEVGKQGRGPGEVLDLRDFDIDLNGNIYILDFQKIHIFKIDGTFINKIPISSSFAKDQYLIPLQIIQLYGGNFFIGNASGVNINSDVERYSLYELTRDGVFINKYLPINYMYASNLNQFKRYKNIILLDPSFGSNIIYSIGKSGLKPRYNIDFGNKTYKKPLPEKFTTSTSFKNDIYENYFHSIRNFIETDQWIYFMFQVKMYGYNVFFSKKLNRSFISKTWPIPSGRVAPVRFLNSYKNNIFGIIGAKEFIEELNNCSQIDQMNLPHPEKQMIERFKTVKETDNPILFQCNFLEY